MFLAVDESFEGPHTTHGCLCVPLEKLPEYEGIHIKKRLEHKVWAEIKWEKLSSSYLPKYSDILRSYLSQPDVTFHSWTYEKPTAKEIKEFYADSKRKIPYCHAYMLIRSVIWKCQNDGYRGPFYIVPHTTGKVGEEEYETTRELLLKDRNIYPRPRVEFCSQGSAQVCGALQVCDICTGAVQYKYDPSLTESKSNADAIISLLESLNGGIPITYSPIKLPSIKEFKLHHCLFDRTKVGTFHL